MKVNLLLLLFCFIKYPLLGQVSPFTECGTTVTKEQIEYLQSKISRHLVLQPTISTSIITFPIKAHIVRTANGTGGITSTELNNAISTMNSFYINSNLKFELCGVINYIDSDVYYDMDADNEDAITSAHDISNVINIYFFNSLIFEGNSICGYAYVPPSSDHIMMVNSCATNGSTLSHEVGHYFSLYHTHGNLSDGTSDELVDGSNCSNSGDYLCDTPADPNLSGKVNINCEYTGTDLDANGQAYMPQTSNIMSYSRKECRDIFTENQYERIAYSAQNDRSYLLCNHCLDDFETNNTYLSATPFFAGPLGIGTSNYAVDANIGFQDDVDWYKVTLAKKGQLIIDLSDLPFDYNMELYGPNGSDQAAISGSYNLDVQNENLNFYNPSDNPTNYYIKLYSNDPNNYSNIRCYNIRMQWSTDVTALVKYEYWFDNEYTNKTSRTLTLQNSLQLTSDIDASSLTDGLHNFHIRFIDDKSLWSSVTSQHFYKFPASNFIDNKIVNYEYWFDNDYTGKVIQNVSPQNPFQLLSDINVNSLNTGLHIFHSRFKDTRSQWSSVVSQHFYKLPSSSFVDNKIIEYEYWYDNDYANKISTSESPQTTLQLINDIKTNTLAQGLHIFHTRFKDAKSLWSSVVSQHFYKSKSNMAFPNFVNGFRYWIDLDTSKVISVSIPVTTNPRYVLTDLNLANLDTGAHLITLQFRDLNGLYSHVISDTFYQLGEARLDTITPAKGGNIGDVTCTIYGTGFYPGTSVKLKRLGYEDIIVPDSLIAITNGQRIRVTFDLRNKEVGFYNLVVEVPSDTTMIMTNAFEIILGINAETYTEIIGPRTLRIGQFQNYSLVYGNKGNVDAVGVPIWLAVSANATIKIEDSLNILLPIDSLFSFDTIPLYTILDSINNIPINAKLYGFIIPRISLSETGTLNFKFKVNSVGEYFIKSWNNESLYHSPLSEDFTDCLYSTAKTVLGLIPGVGCYTGVASLVIDPIVEGVKESPSGEKILASTIWSQVSIVAACVDVIAPGVKLAVEMIDVFVNGFETGASCKRAFDQKFKKDAKVNGINSYDPNDKAGPIGIGDQNFVNQDIPFFYMINFENVDTASAAAQTVCIIDTLDSKVFDISSFALGFIRVADTVIYPPPHLQSYNTLLDLRPQNNIVIKIEGKLIEGLGIVKWTFTSLDPITLLPVTDPFTGFLPPNVTAPEGQGSVFYCISLKDGLSNNAVVENKACIYFDNNEAICTNTWKNTIDNINPHSKVNALPVFINDTTFKVSWSGIDTSSGVQEYSVYYSTNGGPYLPWVISTTDTCKTFYGTLNSVYRFYSIAKDSVGNIEQKSILPDAITTITCQKPTITCPSNIQNLSSGDGCGAIVNFTFGVSNYCLEQTISKISGLASGSYFPIGITMNTFKVTDNFNNTATCSFTVTVSEKIAPIIKCPYSLLRKNDLGKCGAKVNFTATATDNCDLQPILTYNYPSGSFFSTGVTKVTATATDKSGNSSTCFFNITVSDTQRPNIICPIYQVRYTESGLCKYLVKVSELDPIVSDNCGISGKSYSLTGATVGSGNSSLNNILFNQGLTKVVWTVSDKNDQTKLNSNINSCSFNVQVNDSVPPKLICPADVQFTTLSGQCTVGFNTTPLGIPSGITDNCAVQLPVINNDPKIYTVGITNVIWTASDIFGNKRTCTQRVTVIPYVCNSPTSLTITDITKNSARVKWQASACSSEYQVGIRQEITNGVWGTWSNWIASTGPGLSHLFTGLTANKYYNFQIRSRCGTVYSSIVNGKFWTKVNSSSPELKTRNTEDESNNSSSQPNITVIPNPASSYATVSIEGYDKSEKQIIMSTLFGHQIFEAQLDAKTNNLELDLKILNVTTGVYLIRVFDAIQHNTVQLMVVR